MDLALLIIILAVAFILGVFVLPQIFVRRAIRSVLRIFQQHNAVGVKGAKTLKELGLEPKSMFRKIFKTRDYKPQALQALMHNDIILMTEDGKFYLSEEKLITTGLLRN